MAEEKTIEAVIQPAEDGVLEFEQPDGRKLPLARVDQTDGDHVVLALNVERPMRKKRNRSAPMSGHDAAGPGPAPPEHFKRKLSQPVL